MRLVENIEIKILILKNELQPSVCILAKTQNWGVSRHYEIYKSSCKMQLFELTKL